jgi:signal peptidase I
VFILLIAATALAIGRGRIVAVTIQGNSMRPTLCAGDRIAALRIRARVRRGWIVVVALDERQRRRWTDDDAARPGVPDHLVKRVAGVAGDEVPDGAGERRRLGPGQLYLLGDGHPSMDSRRLGPFDETAVIAVALRRSRHTRRPAG